MTPYCISIFDGVITESFYLTNYSDPELMLKDAIYFLMRKKYHQYKVYVHNFSHFDGVFLLGVLSSLSDILVNFSLTVLEITHPTLVSPS